MKTNIGKKERMIRFVVAIVIIALGFFLSGWLSTVLYVLGALTLLTAAFGFCPAYMVCPIGKKAESKSAAKPPKKKKK